MPPSCDCPICCNKYTHTRKTVTCNFCGQDACSACVRQFLLSQPADAHCMGCKRAWDREFLDGALPKTFMLGEYKRHREQVLCDRELALLPAAQQAVAGYREAKELERRIKELMPVHAPLADRYRELKNEVDKLQRRLHGADGRDRRLLAPLAKQTKREAALANRERKASWTRLAAARDRLALLKLHRFVVPAEGDAGAPAAAAETDRRFVRACPAEGCRGFLSTRWKCGTCDARACPTCHELMEGDGGRHACNPDSVASAALIAKDSKPCPGCGSMIHKVSGCPQMFCVQCKVAFDWRTGHVVTNPNAIHNPHYFEWLRRTRGQEPPRTAGDDPCAGLDGMPSVLVMNAHESFRGVREYYRLAVHVRNYETFRVRQMAPPEDDLDLRVQYLAQDLDAATWRAKLQRREKLREKLRLIIQVYDMYYAASVDIFRAFDPPSKDWKETRQEAEALLTYTNGCLQSIAKRLQMRVVPLSLSMYA